jgi:hypothetical protein
MKKLGITTALVLSLLVGAGSALAQNSNTSGTGDNRGASMGMKHHRRHHRKARRHHRRKAAAAANANANR